MCIVIDINTLACVFNVENSNHADFAPVDKWIRYGKGFLVYGGIKYKGELEKMPRYLRIIRLLKDEHNVKEINEEEVNRCEEEIKTLTENNNCDDQHIIAILSVSGCLLLCSNDEESYEFVKNRRFYRRGRVPRIYKSSRNRNLLCDRFIVELNHVV